MMDSEQNRKKGNQKRYAAKYFDMGCRKSNISRNRRKQDGSALASGKYEGLPVVFGLAASYKKYFLI
jgi:hypothetical protein